MAVTPHINVGAANMKITIDNFYDDAQFLVRFNEKQPDTVQGGKLTPVTGNLYLLDADTDTVTISFK